MALSLKPHSIQNGISWHISNVIATPRSMHKQTNFIILHSSALTFRTILNLFHSSRVNHRHQWCRELAWSHAKLNLVLLFCSLWNLLLLLPYSHNNNNSVSGICWLSHFSLRFSRDHSKSTSKITLASLYFIRVSVRHYFLFILFLPIYIYSLFVHRYLSALLVRGPRDWCYRTRSSLQLGVYGSSNAYVIFFLQISRGEKVCRCYSFMHIYFIY